MLTSGNGKSEYQMYWHTSQSVEVCYTHTTLTKPLIKEGKLFSALFPHMNLPVNWASAANERFLQTALYFTPYQSIMTAFTCSCQDNHLKVDQTYLNQYKSNNWWRRMLSARKKSSRAICSALVTFGSQYFCVHLSFLLWQHCSPVAFIPESLMKIRDDFLKYEKKLLIFGKTSSLMLV